MIKFDLCSNIKTYDLFYSWTRLIPYYKLLKKNFYFILNEIDTIIKRTILI